MSSSAALSYHEPGIATILTLSSFLVLENAVCFLLDRIIFCGLIGQIAIGVAWGTPGGKWISLEIQDAIMQLGYIGLILIVYEGGLSTDLKIMKSNLILSSLTALIGIGAPIGLSFTLQSFMNITKVQAFAAGAALCSTSLGTTFTVLSTSGLVQSRLGVVLSSAAMLDDIVGLVMSSIVSSLGRLSDFSAITIVRPVFVSIAFIVVLPLLCLFIVKFLTRQAYTFLVTREGSRIERFIRTEGSALIFHTSILAVLVSASSFAGTSNLFAAYLAGASSNWWDDLIHRSAESRQSVNQQSDEINLPDRSRDPGVQPVDTRERDVQSTNSNANSPNGALRNDTGRDDGPDAHNRDGPRGGSVKPLESLRAAALFVKYFQPALRTILKPFFFASIGFSIPISQMFRRTVVWKGFVYSVLMAFAKMLCGLLLLRLPSPLGFLGAVRKHLPSGMSRYWPLSHTHKLVNNPRNSQTSRIAQTQQAARTSQANQNSPCSTAETPALELSATETSNRRSTEQAHASPISQPVSLYPAALVACAMVSRGEIGFLISSLAESNGVFGSTPGKNSDLYLVVTWAILLCTLLGPVAVGLMVKRVKRLQEMERSRRTGKQDPLGPWGIVPSDDTTPRIYQ